MIYECNGLTADVAIKLYTSGPLRAYAKVVINNTLIIRNIRVVEIDDRLIVSMPCTTLKEGGRVDVVHPIHPQGRAWLEDRVIGAYLEAVREHATDAEYHAAIDAGLIEPPALQVAG